MNQQDTNTGIKIITPTVHGVLDYLAIVLFVVLPSLIDPLVGWYAVVLYLLAGFHLIVTLATRFSAGMFDALSFRGHGLVELLIAILLVVSPWLFSFADMTAVRNTYVAAGVGLFVVWLLTEYRPASLSAQDHDADAEKVGQEAAGSSSPADSDKSDHE